MSDDDDGDELAGRLDEDFAEWTAALSAEQRQAIRAWQNADDRFYQRIQRVFAGMCPMPRPRPSPSS